VSAENPSVAQRSWPVAGRVAVFLGCGVVAAALGAVFQRISASRVALDDLGAFNAILAVVGGTGLLGLGLQVVVVRQRLGTGVVLRVGGVVTVVTVAAAVAGVPGPAWYRWAVAGLIGAAVASTFCGLLPRSVLLWRRRWVELGVVYVVGAVARVAAVVPLLEIVETRILAAIGAIVVAELAMVLTALALNAAAARRPERYGSEPLAGNTAMNAAVLRRLAPTVVVLVGLWALTVVDTVLVRMRLPATEADSYALASTVARSSFFLAVLIAHLALPTFMRERGRSTWLKRAFDIATAAIAVVAIAVAGVVVAWPSGVARLVLGDEASVIDDGVLRTLAVMWAALSLVPLLTFFTIDRHPRLAATPLVVAAALFCVGLSTQTAQQMAVVALIGALICLLVMGVPALHRLSPVTRAVPWGGVATRHTLERGSNAEVAMVVPFFNPGGAALVSTVHQLAEALENSGRRYRIIAVSDGSTDGSERELLAAAINHVEVLPMPHNRGKGAALRVGFTRADGATWVGFIDADGDLPPHQVINFLDIAETSDAEAIVGSKLHSDSVLSVQQRRRLFSSLFRGAVRVLFRLDVRDTQTGLKVYSGAMLAPLVGRLAEDGFAIDVEILVAARRRGTLRIVEAPVTLVRQDPHASTVSARRAIATVRGLSRIFWRDRVAMRYDRAPLDDQSSSDAGAAQHAQVQP
jgi:hypothetical protein